MFPLKQLNQTAHNLVRNFRWTNTYGVARSLLAFGLLLTLVTNNIYDLLQPLPAKGKIDDYQSIAEYSLYNLFPDQTMFVVAFSVLVLIIVIIGWRPRITGFFHWWVSFSFVNSSMVIDGGDQIIGLMTLLLLPICLADPRKSHWSKEPLSESASYTQQTLSLIAIASFFIIRLQVAFIYFHAGIGKLAVDEWINGTAVYYWFNHPNFGLSPMLKPLFDPVLNSSFTVTLLNWGVILFELLLFLGLTIPNKWRPALLRAGLLFHLMIIVVHGLASFFFAMAGALVLYLGPVETGFKMPAFLKTLFQKKVSGFSTIPMEPRISFFQKTFSKIVKS